VSTFEASQILRTETVRKALYGYGMPTITGHVTDFDFLTGTWAVANRRLTQRFVASDDWDVFDATVVCEPRLGGVANVEQFNCPDRGFIGMTVRLFDVAAQQWSIYWANSTIGRLEPPVVGGFDGAVGHFEGIDTDDGVPIDVRFTWTVIDADHAHWQQAFSRDGVASETNWIMEFTRS
jgi:hypothetical protein